MHFDPEELGPAIVDATPHSLGIEHGGKKRLMVCSCTTLQPIARLVFAGPC